MPDDGARVHCFVSGKVQGVYYRNSTVRKAKRLGLVGWVRNLADTRVEFVAQGSKAKLEELLVWAKKGPDGAIEVGITDPLVQRRRVSDIKVAWASAKDDLGDEFVRRKTGKAAGRR